MTGIVKLQRSLSFQSTSLHFTMTGRLGHSIEGRLLKQISASPPELLLGSLLTCPVLPTVNYSWELRLCSLPLRQPINLKRGHTCIHTHPTSANSQGYGRQGNGKLKYGVGTTQSGSTHGQECNQQYRRVKPKPSPCSAPHSLLHSLQSKLEQKSQETESPYLHHSH